MVLVDSSGKTATAVAGELGIISQSLRGWYRRAKADRGEGTTPGHLTSTERELDSEAEREIDLREGRRQHPGRLRTG